MVASDVAADPDPDVDAKRVGECQVSRRQRGEAREKI